MCCLHNENCSKAIQLEKAPIGLITKELPSAKKALILMVCHRFGIPTKYVSKGENRREIDVTFENIDEFHNLDFLITTKEALTAMLRFGGEDVIDR